MNLIKKIREILYNSKLDTADKLIEIEQSLPKLEGAEKQISEIFGAKCEVTNIGNDIVFDGSKFATYVDNPVLDNPNDIYYTCGCTWGVDKNGDRYHKRYHTINSPEKYNYLSHGDIIDEKARIKQYVKEALIELGY
jgi:hypothetical protein